MSLSSAPEQNKPVDLQHMLAEMDQAIADEIVKQTKSKRIKHTGTDGTLHTEENGQYIYQFTLTEPWEPQDDTPLTVANNTTEKINCTVVNSTGTTITITSDAALPPDMLRQIDFYDDSTELLKRLQDALKQVNGGSAKLGSKSFRLIAI